MAGTVDLDAILLELGQFGRYQIRNYCYIVILICFSAAHNTQYIFTAADVPYRCLVPECESSPPEFDSGAWGPWALPDGGGRCERLVPTGKECTPASFSSNQTMRCDVWVYKNHNTIVSEFNLACRDWLRTLVGTVHIFGVLASLPTTAYISDMYGRRTALVIASVSPAVVGVIRAYSTSYIMYLSFEFLDSLVGGGICSTVFVLAVEMVGLDKRVLGGNLIAMSYAIGQVMTAGVAWLIPHWKTYTIATYAPSVLLLVYFWLIEESVRWLLSKGKHKEAAAIIFKAAKMNGKKLSPETIRLLTEEPEKDAASQTEAQPPELDMRTILAKVIKSRKLMLRLLVCSYWWITLTFVYYGLSINSVTLVGNSYMNFILTSFVEIPGYSLSVLTLDRYGRKSSIMTAFIVCGVSLVAMPFVPKSLSWLSTGLNLMGKLCISMAFSSIYIYTGELFPTQARHTMLGTCSMVGRFGTLVAMQTPLLLAYMESLPYLIFGIVACTAGLLMLLTPETLKAYLPDTIEQAEKIEERKVIVE